MKGKHLFILAILLSICLSGCNKHEVVPVSSADFGESESTEENMDNRIREPRFPDSDRGII